MFCNHIACESHLVGFKSWFFCRTSLFNGLRDDDVWSLVTQSYIKIKIQGGPVGAERGPKFSLVIAFLRREKKYSKIPKKRNDSRSVKCSACTYYWEINFDCIGTFFLCGSKIYVLYTFLNRYCCAVYSSGCSSIVFVADFRGNWHLQLPSVNKPDVQLGVSLFSCVCVWIVWCNGSYSVGAILSTPHHLQMQYGPSYYPAELQLVLMQSGTDSKAPPPPLTWLTFH